MKALFYEEANKLSIRETTVPSPGEREVLIKVAYVGICGTDMHCYHGGMEKRVTPPVILGHEFSGVIEEVGENCSLINGERVTVEPLISCGECSSCKAGEYNLCKSLNLIGIDSNGAMANFIKVPERIVYPLDNNLSLKEGALVEPLAVCIHLLEKAKLMKGQYILVVGGGPIGLITAMVAKLKGAQVVISEINESRIKTANQYGLNVINPVKQNLMNKILKETNRKGADISVEATGTNPGLVSCLEATGALGKIIIAGLPKKTAEIDTYKIIAKELQIIGTRVYKREDYEKAIELLETSEFDFTSLISRFVTLEESIEYGFKAIERQEDVIKILISLEDENK